MFGPILVPVDGSPFSEQALPYAFSLGEQPAVPVHIVLVHVPETYHETMPQSFDEVDQDIRHKEGEYLADLQVRLQALGPTPFATHHPTGAMPETFEQVVAERKAGLVVMSTHGRGYMARAILGSNTHYFVQNLNVPILLVHPPEQAQTLRRFPGFRNILVPLDGSELAEKILDQLDEFSRLGPVQFHLLRAVGPRTHFFGAFTDSASEALAAAKEEAGAYLEKTAEILRARMWNVQTHIAEHASPATAILEHAAALGCDLIAQATHGRGGLTSLLMGSVTDKVLRTATTPVLLYRPR